jgi:hypothetical protein
MMLGVWTQWKMHMHKHMLACLHPCLVAVDPGLAAAAVAGLQRSASQRAAAAAAAAAQDACGASSSTSTGKTEAGNSLSSLMSGAACGTPRSLRATQVRAAAVSELHGSDDLLSTVSKVRTHKEWRTPQKAAPPNSLYPILSP